MAEGIIGYRLLGIGNSAVIRRVDRNSAVDPWRAGDCFAPSTTGSARSDELCVVTPERWQSGRMRALGKRVNSQGFRGFESLPLRHSSWHGSAGPGEATGNGAPMLD